MVSVVNHLPQDPLLKEVIEYYYFLSSNDVNGVNNFVHFPHYRNTLNVYFDANVLLEPLKRTIEHNPTHELTTVFTNNKSSFKKATLIGPFDIVGVCFKPLGFHHFISEDLIAISKEATFFLPNYWKGFDKQMLRIKESITIEEKATLLDEFFKGQYRPFQNKTIKHLVAKIIESKGTLSLRELEDSSSLNRRTLLRHAKRHLNCSISNFKQIVKFRHALEDYQNSNEKPSLTELSYANDYYDQSDFINHFKLISGEKPSTLLRELKKVDSKDLYWKFF